MADRRDLDFTYSLIDRLFRLSLGEQADFSGAKFDGDFSLTLEQAQRRKHDYVAERVGIGPGRRLLDLGCGWGPLLAYNRERGGAGVGVTLSTAQLRACRRHGLDVHLLDARAGRSRRVRPVRRGREPRRLRALLLPGRPRGRPPGRDLRRACSPTSPGSLPPGGRLYLQTMTFGPNAGDPVHSDVDAPPDSDAYYLGLMAHQFPGSFLPSGREQIVRAAAPHLELVESSSGRLDYIETIARWRRRFAEPRVAQGAREGCGSSPAGCSVVSSGSPSPPGSAPTPSASSASSSSTTGSCSSARNSSR